MHSLCDVGLLSCGRAVRKRGNQLVMCSLCLVALAKGSHALGGPGMDVSRALFSTVATRPVNGVRHQLANVCLCASLHKQVHSRNCIVR